MKTIWLPLLVAFAVACSPPQFSGVVTDKEYNGDVYMLTLEKCDVELSKKCKRTNVDVSKSVYDNLEVGDLYIR